MDCVKKESVNNVFHVDLLATEGHHLTVFSRAYTSDPEEAKLQLIVFHGSEVRATIYPAVMQEYNLSVIVRLRITDKSAEAKITMVAVIRNNHFHAFIFREMHH